MSRRGWLAALFAGACLIPAVALAEPARRALVIGNGDYADVRQLVALPNALNDAGDMSATLTRLGFQVTQARNTDLAAFERDLAAFAGALKPGDTALVFFAGHGVTGRVAAGASGTDSFLLPTDVKLKAPDDVPGKSRGLGAVLAALDAAKAGTRLVIIDACRDNPFAAIWPADEPGAAGGLVQPAATSLRGALVAYATSPGEPASDNREGRNGLFTQELLKRLGTAGAPLSVTLAEVSAAVEVASQGTQIPFFVAGDSNAAALVMKPAAGGAAGPASDPLTLDLRVQRQATECGLAACLEAAALDVRSGALQRALATHAKSLRIGPVGPPGQVVPAALRPPLPTGLTPAAAALATTEVADPDGARRIGRRLMLGIQGFPRDPGAAIAWYRAAAEAGSGGAAYELASAYHDGLPGVSRNRVEAYRWLVAAAKAKYPAAYALGGRYRLEGWGAQLKNLPAAQRWFEAGVGLGDPASALELGKASDDPAQQKALFAKAAAAGLPEGMFRYGIMLEGTAPDYRAITPPEALRLYQAAGDAGYYSGYTRLGWTYFRGNASVPADRAAAVRWFRMGAERGDAYAMWSLARALAERGPGIATDCDEAAIWVRRSAAAGDWHAVEATVKGWQCPYDLTPVRPAGTK